MTKQEKIRQGIATYLRNSDGILCLRPDECDDMDCCECQAQGITRYLHSQGAVLKVERELPENPYIIGVFEPDIDSCAKRQAAYNNAQQDMLKWHKDSLESLL